MKAPRQCTQKWCLRVNYNEDDRHVFIFIDIHECHSKHAGNNMNDVNLFDTLYNWKLFCFSNTCYLVKNQYGFNMFNPLIQCIILSIIDLLVSLNFHLPSPTWEYLIFYLVNHCPSVKIMKIYLFYIICIPYHLSVAQTCMHNQLYVVVLSQISFAINFTLWWKEILNLNDVFLHIQAVSSWLLSESCKTNNNKAIRDGKYLAPPHASAWQRSPH